MVHRIGVLVCLVALATTGRANGAPPPQFNIIVDIQNYAMVDKWTLRTPTPVFRDGPHKRVGLRRGLAIS
jgi:hypothetical protein